jgi:hypothetical protein
LNKKNENIVSGFIGIALVIENNLANEIIVENNLFIIHLNHELVIESIEKYLKLGRNMKLIKLFIQI